MLQQFDKAFRDAHCVSPSQADTIELCERKWAYEKLEGLPRPPNEFAQVGLDVHAVLEQWQKTGGVIDLTTDIGKIIAPGLKFLPRPGTHITEHDFAFDTGRVTFHGRMDLRGPADARVQTVWDHKTTGSFAWLKSPQVLRRDNQAVIYAKAVLEEAYWQGLVWGESLDRVELNWVYYIRNPERPRSRKVQLVVVHDDSSGVPSCPEDVRPEHFGVMTLAELEKNFIRIEQEVGLKILAHHWAKLRAADLPYNVAACSAYGGCPYQDNPCELTLAERIEAMEAQEKATNVTLADKIRASMAKTQAGQGAEGGPPQATPPTVTAPAAPPIPPVPPPQAGAPSQAPGQPAAGPPPAPPGLAKLAAAQTPQEPPAAAQPPQEPSAATQTAAQSTGGPPPPPALAKTLGAQAPAAQVNPPEKAKGVDPDAPAQRTSQGARVISRAEMTMEMAKSLVEARVYSLEDNRYEKKIADQSVKLADMIFAVLSAK